MLTTFDQLLLIRANAVPGAYFPVQHCPRRNGKAWSLLWTSGRCLEAAIGGHLRRCGSSS